jgi:hypothetical protein
MPADEPGRMPVRARSPILALAVVAAIITGPSAQGAPSSGRPVTDAKGDDGSGMVLRRATRMAQRSPAARPLVFGIYPGGAAGTVGPSGQTRPEVAELRMRALQQLRGARRPFVLHLYESYTAPSDGDAVPSWLASQIADYTAQGFGVELVLAYRPSDPGGNVDGFVEFVRRRVQQLGPVPGVTHLQVTNEANVGGAPNAADGFYPGAREALVHGVIAARDEARRSGHERLHIGFNWAYQRGPAESAFFSSLRALGGRAFADAVDWVGVDAYPGTWGPALGRTDLATGVRTATIDAMRTLRRKLLPAAGLPRAAIHFAESGYPTGPGRSLARQQTVLRTAVKTVSAARKTYGVTDYRWFDLRDADSAAGSFESQYGLTRDDYSPKPAFFTYRDLIARLTARPTR